MSRQCDKPYRPLLTRNRFLLKCAGRRIEAEIGKPASNEGQRYSENEYGRKVLMGASVGSKSGTYPYTASTSFGYTPTIWNIL